MFKQGEQLTFNFFDEPIKKEPVEKLGKVNQTTHNGNYIEFMCIRTKSPTTLKAKNIKRFIWSSSNNESYIQKNDGVLCIGLTLNTMKHISKCYNIEIIECFKYREIMSICVFENGETRDLKEINE